MEIIYQFAESFLASISGRDSELVIKSLSSTFVWLVGSGAKAPWCGAARGALSDVSAVNMRRLLDTTQVRNNLEFLPRINTQMFSLAATTTRTSLQNTALLEVLCGMFGPTLRPKQIFAKVQVKRQQCRLPPHVTGRDSVIALHSIPAKTRIVFWIES